MRWHVGAGDHVFGFANESPARGGALELMTVSMFDHPLLSGLLGDEETAKHFSIEAEFKAIEIFEVALVRASTEFGLVPHTAMTQIVEKLDKFAPDLMRLISASAQDGTIIPDLIAQMHDHIGEPDAQYLHLGATSQDVIDTSLVLRMSQVFSIFEKNDLRQLSRPSMLWPTNFHRKR